MTRGDVDILRVALSKLTAGRRHEVVEALLKRLENGTIGGDELAVLRKLVDKERTVRSLIIRQHEPGPDPDPAAPPLQTLEALKAKLEQATPSDG
jgi:hypothetical protein